MECDLGAVGAIQGVPAASNPERIQAVRLQVTHRGAGTMNAVSRPPDLAVFTVLSGRGLAWVSES